MIIIYKKNRVFFIENVMLLCDMLVLCDLLRNKTEYQKGDSIIIKSSFKIKSKVKAAIIVHIKEISNKMNLLYR